MADFQITLPCVECKNTGEIEHQIAADDFSISICENCWGNGFKSHTEMYDCLGDARLDYPNALGIEISPELSNAPEEWPGSRMRFDGPAYDPKHDQKRLTGQILRVFSLMRDSRWRTLSEIEKTIGDPAASVSAQLRHLRKERFGSHIVDKRARGKRGTGLWEYRLTPAKNEITKTENRGG